jgi:hypothetical protein
MTVREILRYWLTENGYDGLAGDDCGCGITDLFVCESCPDDCVPAHQATDAEIVAAGEDPEDVRGHYWVAGKKGSA